MVESVGGNASEIHGGNPNRDVSDAVHSEISALRAEIASIRSSLSQFGSETYETVTRQAEQAATYVQDEASTVAGVIREHPATATTLFTLVGGLGFALGYLVASTSFEQKQAWYQRYY